MVKIEKNKSLITNEITKKRFLSDGALSLYIFLMSYQQEKIYYQTIKEISKDYKKAYKTIQKYINELKRAHLIEKYHDLYILNYYPQIKIKM